MCKVINIFSRQEVKPEVMAKPLQEQIKRMTAEIKYMIGQEIYYTGDVANHSGEFIIYKATNSKVLGVVYVLKEIAGDRVFNNVFECSIADTYKGNCGDRFVTMTAYNEYKNKMFEQYQPKINKTETMLNNEYCSIALDNDCVSGRDLTDSYNEPAFYTRNKRSIKKGWKDLSESFNGETTMHDAITILDKYNLRCHSYCMMD